MKVFVTGGGGFLGTAICRKLIEAGHDVISFSRHDHGNLSDMGVDHKTGSIINLDAVVRSSNQCDAVIHTAAKAGVWGSFDSFYKPNVTGTENILTACREHKITKLVFTSSPSVVFDGKDQNGVNESVPYPDTFDAPYSQTKALAEKLVLDANNETLATVALRPHLIWGPNDPHLVKRIVNRGRKNKLRRIGNENKLIDSIYVDNAAEAHVQALVKLETGCPCAGNAYFISNNEPVPAWNLVNRILDAATVKPVTKTISTGMAMRIAHIMEFLYKMVKSESEPLLTPFVVKELTTAHWFDTSAAQHDLDYYPEISIDEGLKRLKQWFDQGGYQP